MLSHGVDVSRLNVMVMLGLPLTTAEFIQTSARVGRTGQAWSTYNCNGFTHWLVLPAQSIRRLLRR